MPKINICLNKHCMMTEEEVQFNTNKRHTTCPKCGMMMARVEFKGMDEAITYMVRYYQAKCITRFAGYLTRHNRIRFW